MGTMNIGKVLPVLLLFAEGAFAQVQSLPMSVNTTVSGESVTSAPASGTVTRSGNSTVTVKIVNSCFGTNLRGVTNPLAPSSTITANLTLVIGSKSYPIMVKYPAYLVQNGGMIPANNQITPMDASNYSIPGGGSAGIYGNTVILKTPFPTNVNINEAGTITDADPGSVYLQSTSFSQVVGDCNVVAYGAYGVSSYIPAVGCKAFMGQNGTLSATIGGISVSSDKSNVELNVSFPGQTGFCGGYYSPLMVFFDKDRPKFTNVSNFPINGVGTTYWPESNHAGYFLAYDKDGSGKITSKDQLFGDNGKEKNGFEVLKKFDTNHDGVIDRRDKEFDKLVLWQDKNGDGISQPEELIKLSKKVTKISLKYKDDRVRKIAVHAEERQYSVFWYKDVKGKVKKGDIVDVWFEPARQPLLTQNQK